MVCVYVCVRTHMRVCYALSHQGAHVEVREQYSGVVPLTLTMLVPGIRLR